MIKVVAYDSLPEVEEASVNAMRQVSDRLHVVAPSVDDLAGELADAEIFYGHHHPDVFRNASKLRWIQSSAAGVDILIDKGLAAGGITITNASGVHAPQVAETAWALTLATTRNLSTYFVQQQQRHWELREHIDLDGATVGIIGFGGIGRRYAQAATAFGLRILAVDNQQVGKPDFVDELWGIDRLEDLLGESDIVVLACPYTDATHHLLNADRFSQMKPTGVLINIARGSIVDETALMAALKNGQIAAAGIDVCETEPLPSSSPLWDTPNLIITPHTAGLSPGRIKRLTDFFCANLRRYLNEEPLLNVVDPKLGYPPPQA